jgi:hypothetical protein
VTDFADFKTQIADWANRQDWSDALVTSFVRQAEQKFNSDLRVDRMIRSADNLVTCRCSEVPDDWLEADLIKIANTNGADGFLPIRYKARDEFFNLTDKYAYGYYTIVGRTITFGGAPDAVEGVAYRMTYYGEVPVFADDTPSWIYTKYPKLYLHAALANADFHAVGEEDKAMLMEQSADAMIAKLNAEHLRAKASGSRLTRSRVRSFG